MRSHAKASTAGSTQRQAGRLGRFIRGAFAGRGVSSDAKGSGASAARHFVIPAGVLAALLLLMASTAGLAFAAKTHPFKETFGSAAQPSFTNARGIAIDQSSGAVLVLNNFPSTISRYNADGTPSNFSALGTNVIDGQGTGDETPQNGLGNFNGSESQIAVDNSGGATDGNIYVTQSSPNLINVFSEDGEYLGQLTAAGATPFSEVCGVAVDPNGAVYVGGYGGGIHKFVPAANPPVNADNTATFTTTIEPCTLAAGAGPSAGFLFAAQYSGPISKLDSSSGEFKYAVSPDSHVTLTVDSASGNVLAVTNGEVIKEFDASGSGSATSVSIIPLPSTGQGVATDSSGDIFASRVGGSNLLVFDSSVIDPPPTIKDQQAQDVIYTEATLKATINPEGLATTYHIEYGTTGSYGQSTPEIGIGSDEADHVVTRAFEGLAPDTTYHYRFVATNAGGTTEGPDHTFTTYPPFSPDTNCANQTFRTGPALNLADCRAYEMVSPLDKAGGEITTGPTVAGRRTDLIQAALDGEKITYASVTSFGDQPSGHYTNQYIASRGPNGWTTHGINAPQETTIFDPIFQPFMELQPLISGFSEDLSNAWFEDFNEVPLTPAGQPNHINLYRRDNTDDSFEALTVNESLGPTNDIFGEFPFTPAEVQGFSKDGSLAVFAANAKFTPNASDAGNRQLYEYSDGEISLVSVLPNGEPSTTLLNGVGTYVFNNHIGQWRASRFQDAVSDDGSRIFWSASEAPQGGPGRIYVRVDGEATLPVSSAVAHFWAASSNGSKALFSEGGVLKEFNVDSESTTTIAETVGGVVGASDDLSYIYFVSQQDLADGATAGTPNLYLAHDGAKTFIATLDPEDTGGLLNLVDPIPGYHNGRVTPDGQHVIFQSESRLTGYDNTDAVSGEPDIEVFVYDANSEELICASCNPSGARPTGQRLLEPFPVLKTFSNDWAAAWLTTEQTSFHSSRTLSDDGNYVFFNAHDALVPQDTNGAQDVYEWRSQGISGCERPNGCVSLLSTGESPRVSEFAEASADGRDVFFETASSIHPEDPGSIDLYNARSGGGYPYAPPGIPCEGDACQNIPSAPNDATPASASFKGAGDPKPRKARTKCRARNRKAAKGSKAAKRKAAKRCSRAKRGAGR